MLANTYQRNGHISAKQVLAAPKIDAKPDGNVGGLRDWQRLINSFMPSEFDPALHWMRVFADQTRRKHPIVV